VIVLGDPPEAWEALGFRVEEGLVALGEERLQLTGRGGGILEITAPGHYKTIDTVNGVEVASATA